MDRELPRVQPGDPITADHYNAIADALMELGIDVAIGGGLNLSGNTLSKYRKAERWIKLTSVSGSGSSAVYAWTTQLRAGGAWVDGLPVGTTTDNPAIRENGTNALTLPTIVRAWQEVDGLHFLASDC